MKVACVYFEAFWSETVKVVCKDKYEDLRLGADLPLGLATVRAFAERDARTAGQVEFVNRTFTDADPEKDVVARIRETSPDIVAFSIFLWNAPRTYRICELIKKGSKSAPLIVIGGPELPRKGAAARAFLKERPAVDIGVCGEGEEAFADLLCALLGAKPLGEIEGLVYRDKKKVVVTKPRGGIMNLARIPSPYLEGAVQSARSDRGMICVETSRGCPMACAYCDYHAGRRKMRLFPLKRLKAELKALRGAGFTGCIYITDPYLNVKKERALEVFRILAACKNRFLMELKAETFDAEMVEALGRVCAATISLGIQSINPDALQNVNRRFNLTRCGETIRKLLAYPNIQVELEFILGLPGDDYESFKRTVDWALQFSPGANFTLFDLVMLPNAPLAEMVDKFSIRTDEEGLVTSNATFSEEDFKKASWLFVAYRYLRDTPGLWQGFMRTLSGGRSRPSDGLEKVGRRLVRSGFIPAERIVGQGGRRKSKRLGKDGKPTRWVDLSDCRRGVEAEAWW